MLDQFERSSGFTGSTSTDFFAAPDVTGSLTTTRVWRGLNERTEEEIKRFEWKVEAGAEYAITQPVFDTEQLREFLKRIEHVRIPIIAGVWPLVSFRNADFLHNEVPGVRVTPEIRERMRIASDKGKEHAREEGLTIAQESLEEIIDQIQGVQVSAPFGKVKLALRVLGILPRFQNKENIAKAE